MDCIYCGSDRCPGDCAGAMGDTTVRIQVCSISGGEIHEDGQRIIKEKLTKFLEWLELESGFGPIPEDKPLVISIHNETQ